MKFVSPLLGNTLLFLETGFFKKYKLNDAAYERLFKYSANGSIILCTSDLCLEEWRTQKIQDLENNLITLDQKIYKHVSSHCGENFFSKIMLADRAYSELRNPTSLKNKSRDVVTDFVREHKIRRQPLKEKHIESTWDGYFDGSAPYKKRKNKDDIPDAWIFEGAKDASVEPEYQSALNRFCISGDDEMRKALTELGFNPIALDELIQNLRLEEEGTVANAIVIEDRTSLAISSNPETSKGTSKTQLDILLAKSTNSQKRDFACE